MKWRINVDIKVRMFPNEITEEIRKVISDEKKKRAYNA